MAKLAEVLVIEYLTRTGCFTAQSIKCGTNEWDILALRHAPAGVSATHYEVQVSFDPVSYLSQSNARWRRDEQVVTDMELWLQKKYEHPKIVQVRKSFYPGQWSYGFIHGVIKDHRELDYMRQHHIETTDFTEIIESLCSSHPRTLPFTGEAKDLVELLRFATKDKRA